MRLLGPLFIGVVLLAGCGDAAVSAGEGAIVERDAEPWLILHQRSDDGARERIIAHELGAEVTDDVVLYAPRPAHTLRLCTAPVASVLRRAESDGYAVDTFFDEGEAFGFEPASLGPHRVTGCPVWSATVDLGVAYSRAQEMPWGSYRTLVLDSRGDEVRAVPLEPTDARAAASTRIDAHRYAVVALDAEGSTLRIVDIDDPDGAVLVHRHEGAEPRTYIFGVLEDSLLYVTPGDPGELRAFDLNGGGDRLLATRREGVGDATMVRVDDRMVVSDRMFHVPASEVFVVADSDDGLIATPRDLSAIPAAAAALRQSAAGELVYTFETQEHHGYAMVDPGTDGPPRVVAQYSPEEWLLGPSFNESLGLGAATLMRGETPLRLVWFALDGSTPEMESMDIDISSCDADRSLFPVASESDASGFTIFCSQDGVLHSATWSSPATGQTSPWEGLVRRIETTEGPLVLHSVSEFSGKLLGSDVAGTDDALVLVDLASGGARRLENDGWSNIALFAPAHAE